MNTNIKIQPPQHTDAEYEGIVALHRAAYPNYADTPEVWKADDENRDSQYFYQRLIASIDGQLVATGSYEEPSWVYEDGKYFIRIVVHPDYRRRGIASTIYDRIVKALKPRQPTIFTASTNEDQPEAMRFLADRGFQQILREPMSRLDVKAFDVSQFKDNIARVEALRIQILSGAILIEQDPQFWQKIYDLDAIVTQDLPLPAPYTMPTFEAFVKDMSDERRGFAADFWMVAVAPPENDGGFGKYIGRSTLWQDMANSQNVRNGLTGVLREYRRQGLATVLKARAIEAARQHGVKLAETQSAETNPMLQLNLTLGFRIFNAYLGYEKRLVIESG